MKKFHIINLLKDSMRSETHFLCFWHELIVSKLNEWHTVLLFFFQQKLRSIRCNQWASEKCIFWCGKQSNAIEYIKWSFVHLYLPLSIQKSSYLLCENQPLDAHAHTHWAIVLARNRATARTHNCSVQYFFSRFHSLPQSIESVQRLNHMCVCLYSSDSNNICVLIRKFQISFRSI